MKELKCELSECRNMLSSLPEIGTGLCDRHYSQLMCRENYAIVCWKCNHIHAIEPSPLQYGRLVFKDKYIYAESCPQCSETSRGEDWMNKPHKDEISNVVLRAGMTLHPGEFGLIQDIKRKCLIKRGPMVTDGQDVFTKVKLSRKEVDHNLNNFLDDLGELDHGDQTFPSE